MFRPLEGCTLAGPLKNPAPAFAAFSSSLLYQANALGLRFDPMETTSTESLISFFIETPRGSPVACEISGWPDDSDGVATEQLIQAACGLMSVHGRGSGRAQPLGLDYVSTLAAVLALQGGLAAAIGQFRGAEVSRSKLSLAATGLLCVGQYIAAASTPDTPEKLLPGASSAHDRPPFISADGVIFELETLDVAPWQAFWAEAGVDIRIVGKGWSSFLLRYAKAIAPLPPALTAALSSMPFAQIAAICTRSGMSLCRTRSLHERAQDQDAEAAWRQGPWSFVSGLDCPDATASHATGDLPLSGVQVIESCRRIQGPLAGHLLALLGANVLRIEPPGGDPLRGMPPTVGDVSARYDALNRLKAVREIDIKSVQGQAEIKELARHADVFLHNWAPGKAAQLQLDYFDFATINPSLIYAYAGGWGPSVQLGAPGTDFMVQAYSGVGSKVAEASNTFGGSLFTVLDVLGGAVAAQGITVALLARCLRDTATKVDTSLLSAATLLCADDLEALLHPREPRQPAPQGADPTIKAVYPTQKGQIAIECSDAKTIARLVEALGLEFALDPVEIGSHLGPALLSRGASDWMAIFARRGIPAAVVVEELCDLHEDERISSCLNRGSYTQVNSPWRFA